MPFGMAALLSDLSCGARALRRNPGFTAWPVVQAPTRHGTGLRWASPGCLGLAALLLAVAGVYAAVSQSVVRRRREIGIRLTLGGRPADIGGWFCGRALRWRLPEWRSDC
jgi:hypothetical protein